MASSKEIRVKIKSVQNTRKITKAMEMVAASKMRRAQERMRNARPYADKIRNITAHLCHSNPEYAHPYLLTRPVIKNVAIILITTDKGLCGGLNTNIQRIVLNTIKGWQSDNIGIKGVAIGTKGLSFLSRLGIDVVSNVVQLGDRPVLDTLLGPIKVVLDAFIAGEVDAVYIASSDFVNSMKQNPKIEQLVPMTADNMVQTPKDQVAYNWNYLYEPDQKTVIDDLLQRYIEALIYQAVAENMACEQSARMVAMKSASDNAKKVIGDLQLVYNKTRQAAITKELSEIVGGAAAIA
ncbi:MAG: synthase, sector, gamma subunit [Pseudomonadota bacterium]